MPRFPLFAACTLAACVPEAPTFDPVDAENVISGTVVVDAPDRLGPAVLFLSAADDPMPPLGTGSPVNFLALPQGAFEGEGEPDPTGGLAGAPFAFTGVADGDWLVTGLADLDRDFHPFAAGGAFAGATCGDLVGAYVASAADPTPAPVPVAAGVVVEDLPVLLTRRLTTERPAFQVAYGELVRADAAAGLPQTLRLETTAVHASVLTAGEPLTLDLAGPFDAERDTPCQTAFLATAIDADANGLPDPHPDAPGAPLYDLWPRVYLQWLPGPDDPPLAPGERWVSQAVPSPSHVLYGELAPLNAPKLLAALDLVWLPAAIHERPNGSAEVVTDPNRLPAGAWSVTVVQQTGQTWTVPNGLSQAESLDPSFNPASQGWTVFLR